jgi:hypothetical protein
MAPGATLDTTDATSKAARTRERKGPGTASADLPTEPGGLIFGLIRLRSPASIGIRINAAT